MKNISRRFPWITAVLMLMVLPVPGMAERRLAPVIEPSSPQQPAAGVPGSVPVPTLEERVARMERTLESQGLMEMYQRLEQLQQEVQTLRGVVEVQTNNQEGIEQRQRDLYLDIDRRIAQLEAAISQLSASAASTSATLGVAAAAPAPAEAAPSADPAQEQAAYESAFGLLKDGRYNEAISAFRAMLARFPDGRYTDNAQYWLGEAHYVTRRFPDAVVEFNKVISNHPSSAKLPDAMLKLGFTYYELSDWAEARKTLEEIPQKYPQSTAANLATQRLQKMRDEGH